MQPNPNAKGVQSQLALNLSHRLCGIWDGQCLDVGATKGAPQAKTVWKNVEMYFNIEDSGLGRINGRGTLVGPDNQSLPFLMEGSIRWPYTKIVKVNMSQFVNSQKFVLKIDVTNMRMDGEHKQGTLRLSRTGPIDLTPFLPQTPTIPVPSPSIVAQPTNAVSAGISSSTNPSVTAAPSTASARAQSGPVPFSNVSSSGSSSASTRRSRDGSNAPSATPAAPAANGSVSYGSVREFVISLFGPSGAKYAKMLEEHEVDMEALRLMNESHLKEMGLPMGPRLKILAQLGGSATT